MTTGNGLLDELFGQSIAGGVRFKDVKVGDTFAHNGVAYRKIGAIVAESVSTEKPRVFQPSTVLRES